MPYIPFPSGVEVTDFAIGFSPEQTEIRSKVSTSRAVVTTGPGRMRGTATLAVRPAHARWVMQMSDRTNWTYIPHGILRDGVQLTPAEGLLCRADSTVRTQFTYYRSGALSVDRIDAGALMLLRGGAWGINRHVFIGDAVNVTRNGTINVSPPFDGLPVRDGERLWGTTAIASHFDIPPGTAPEISHSPDWYREITVVWYERLSNDT